MASQGNAFFMTLSYLLIFLFWLILWFDAAACMIIHPTKSESLYGLDAVVIIISWIPAHSFGLCNFVDSTPH